MLEAGRRKEGEANGKDKQKEGKGTLIEGEGNCMEQVIRKDRRGKG